MKRTLGDFAQACGGRLQGADRSFSGVSTDTRTLRPNELFVALRGPNFDGNEFVRKAHEAGAAGAVVDSYQKLESTSTDPQQTRSRGETHSHAGPLIAQIVVDDTLAALTAAARAWRDQFDIPVVGVAGSNGKTTAKEMVASILSQAGACLATRGNLNNHIGVPLTLLRLEASDRFAVIEMGANQPGDVAGLVKLTRPAVGLITNAGAEHLEGFGSLEGVARAEGEMVAGLDPSGTAVINADDEFAGLWREMTPARVLTFATNRAADFRAEDIEIGSSAHGFVTRFTLVSPFGRAPIELKLAGRHNVANALCAAAAASAVGASRDHIIAGLARVEPVKGRLQFKTAHSGAWIIDDSYNANPSSVKAGIEVLAAVGGRRWLVLGDMAELGAFASSAHEEIGVVARESGIERLFAHGALAALAAKSFGAGGEAFTSAESLAAALQNANKEVRMLIKGSRVNRLERVVDALVAPPSKQKAG